MAYCLIHGSKCPYTRYLAEIDIVLGVGNRGDPSRGDSSHSRPPRTIHEALSGFEARGRSTGE